MRVFDVSNKARVGFWCAAPDADAAMEIALKVGHARKKENLSTRDVTDEFLAMDRAHHDGVDAIVNGTQTGQVVGEGHAVSGTEFFKSLKETGRPPKTRKTQWRVM